MSSAHTIDRWQSSHLGRHFLACEREAAAPHMAGIAGNFGVQVGVWGGASGLLGPCRIRNKWVIDINASDSTGLCSNPGQLAVASEVLDTVVLAHVLERVSNPHNVLREAHRVLVGEGQLVVFGFNPWSTWGLPCLMGSGNYPWTERFIGETRLRDWLALLDFEITGVKRFFYRPPINNEKFLTRSQFIERIAARWLPIPPSAYVLITRKKVIGMNPIPVNVKRAESLVNGMTAPTARVLH
ncbi:MAG: methyltransferase domain-containing protein [Gammaproteobacteria bacterium]